ncbi:GumC family protein [Dinoroseobacter sp. S124A]|uniref:GumC family protein n=1 Tax=Dinoroseobacter sp. S124A TaxID=3415128 RepID=UPI003C7ACDB2
MNLSINYLLSVFWRRFPIFILVAGLSIVASAFVAKQLPTRYEASARLLLEAGQIPDELVTTLSNTGAQEQLEVVQQRLLTRANLLDIADRFDVFPNASEMSPDEIVRSMRAKSVIRLTTGRNRATLMSLSFTDDVAQTTSDVVNEYVTLIQREDSRLRTSRASNTEEFFKQEVERLSEEVDERTAAMRQFRSENIGALPETFQFRLERLADLQERSTTYTRDILILNEQRKQLVDALPSGSDPSQLEGNAALTREQEQVEILRLELAEAMETAGETSPRVRILRSRIQQVEGVIQSLGGQRPSDDPTSTLQSQIEQIDAQIAFLREQLELTNTQVEEVEATLDETPGISVTLQGLTRDYQNVQQQYNAAVERLHIAQTGERIELAARGQRITVLEQATTPTDPSSASPMLVFLGGSLAGIGLGLGLILLLELLDRTVRRPVDLVKSLGIAPLATLPYVKTRREEVLERSLKSAIVILVIIGIPVALYAIHMLYLPLDLLADRVLNKIGV